MNSKLLAQIRLSISGGYLPAHWHEYKEQLIKTATGYYALADSCVRIKNKYYHEDNDRNNFVFDDLDEQYILAEESITVTAGRGEYLHTHYDNHLQFYRYMNGYYNANGLNACNLVETADGTIAHRDHVFYWESDGQYHYTDEWPDDDDDSDDYSDDDDSIWDYHEGPLPPDYRTHDKEPGIGFEIEKGGSPEFCGYYDKNDLFEGTGCVMERDGSVDWELKTPIYPLFSTQIEDTWLCQIRDAIDAENHSCAGGHIHLSLPPKSGKQLFDYCRPYLPLFMAMYPARLEVDYCKGKSEYNLKRDDDKHQAIKIWYDRIELRFPAKVYDMAAIRFRLNFCRLMIKKDYKSISAVTLAAFDHRTDLYKLIIGEYKGKEQLLLSRILNVARQYFNTDLMNEKKVATLLKNLKNQKPCVLQS